MDDEQSKSKHSAMLQKQSDEEFKRHQQQMQVQTEKAKKPANPLDGNLAMKFLLKSGDFDSLIHKPKKDTLKKQEQPLDRKSV